MVAQITAAAIFLIMFGLIINEKFNRHIVTLSCGAATLIIVFGIIMRSPQAIWNTLNLEIIFSTDFWYSGNAASESGSGINWETIIFIAGMMIMVEVMAHAGFFKWLCLSIAKAVRFKTVPVFFSLAILSAILAMFIDSITVILFLTAVTIELSSTLKFNPIPFILTEIFCANLGGSATMCGDPPNIIIGTALGYSFGDFLVNTGPIAAVSLAVILIYFYLCFRHELSAAEVAKDCPSPNSAIENKNLFIKSSLIFLSAIILLATHGITGITVASIGVLIGGVSLISSRGHALEIIKKIDYEALLFFTGMFVVVSGLEETGVLKVIAGYIEKASGGNPLVIIAIIIWLSGIASAFVDNIPFAATMIPIIRTLSMSQGIPLETMAWSLALGTDIGGSATPIGASANVVGLATAYRRGYEIKWGKYCKYMIPAAAIVMTISTLWIFGTESY